MEFWITRINAVAILLAALTGCGGGGASDVLAPTPAQGGATAPSAPPAQLPATSPPVPIPVPPAVSPDEASGGSGAAHVPLTRAQASKMLAMGTFGASISDIRAAEGLTPDAWIEAQFAEPASFHTPLLDALLTQYESFPEDMAPEGLTPDLFRRYIWWHHAITAPDALRQRVAFALSEIFVVSDQVEELADHPAALAVFYDLLVANAFGNFRALLEDVTYSPAMGLYLSHLNNRRAEPAENTFPDENYAREVMQLFTIGLFELNADGTRRLDAGGQPIPTYSNREIRGLARVFTGMTVDCSGEMGEDFETFFGQQEPCFSSPMTVFAEPHEPGTKDLVSGVTLPAGQSPREDIRQALDVLFAHPNVGPFIGRRLIQRLVTSNPSAAYVARVSAAFDGGGVTPRGDMKTVIKAVLTDPEALAPPDPSAARAKLQEPVLRYLALARQFNARTDGGFFAITGFLSQEALQQHPLSSPSVFNFYLPDYAPQGAISSAGLVAPEFQITTDSTVVNLSNLIFDALFEDAIFEVPDYFTPVRLDFSEWAAFAAEPDVLLAQIDLVFTAGTMSANTREAIRDAIDPIDDAQTRAVLALYLTLVSPDYAVRI